MSASIAVSNPLENRLLSALPRPEYERLLPDLEYVYLAQGKVLWQVGDLIRYCYFPLNGMLSLLSITEDGDTIEVSMVGNEGMAGIPAILMANKMPYRVMVVSF